MVLDGPSVGVEDYDALGVYVRGLSEVRWKFNDNSRALTVLLSALAAKDPSAIRVKKFHKNSPLH